jgi:hypothetical protein
MGARSAQSGHERATPSRSFSARLRDELLDGDIFYSLAEAKIVIENWRRHYNTERR